MAGMESDPEGERMRRLNALRDLARDSQQTKQGPPATPPSPAPATLAGAALGAPKRRTWLYAVVAGALIVAVVVAGAAWLALGPHGARSVKTAQPLTPFVFTLPASAGVYCPSQPAWSPDGKYLAVMATTTQPGGLGRCMPYGDLVSNLAAQGFEDNGYQGVFGWNAVVLVLDARTGVIVRRLAPSDPTQALCAGASHCDAGLVMPTSLAWSPDSASVQLFTLTRVELDVPNGQAFSQYRGALEIMRADGQGGARLLTVFARKTIIQNNILAVNLYSTPLFVFDLAKGSGRYSDMHEQAGDESVSYAPAYQIGPTGQVSALAAAQPGAISPWTYGALSHNGDYGGGLPSSLLQASQWGWSADGRYVVPDIMTTAYMKIDQVTSGAPAGFPGAYNPPFVAPPDAATLAVVRAVAPRKLTAYVARDPDWTLLASFSCQPDGTTGKLSIRASATGKIVATTLYPFPTLASSLGCPGDAEALNWSPDGSRVAMTDNQDNQIIIWRISAT